MAERWYDDDRLWMYLAQILQGEAILADTPQQVDGIVKLLDLQPSAAVLDLCCGMGRHSLELARRGFKITGVDRTPAYLEKAQAAADAEGLAIEFIHEDMRRFCREGAFDGAINILTSFGYFDDQAEDQQVLANLHRSLKPGGRLVMELISKEIIAHIFQQRDWQELPDGTLHLQERQVTRDWSWMDNRWIFIKGTERHEFNVGFRLYSGIELSAALQVAGFHSVRIFGDLAGAPYDQKAKRLVAVAQK